MVTKKIIIIVSVVIIAVAAVCYYMIPVHVSMFELLENPNKYNLRRVQVEGVGQIEFEGTNLYWSKEIYRDHKYNGRYHVEEIWLDMDPYCYEQIYNGEYVRVVGRFNKWDKGHMCGSESAIQHITRYEKLEGDKK